jgi:putative lipoic acid-binding regulatory protein
MLRPVGFAAGRPHNWPMEIKSDNPEHGFQFPGEFEITAMGPAGSGLEQQIPALLEAAGLAVLHESVSTRESSGGKFVSVKLSFRAESREQYDVAHAVLREHPEVKWTL